MFFRHFNNLSHISTFESYLNNIHPYFNEFHKHSTYISKEFQ
jgi:hypothetical protein